VLVEDYLCDPGVRDKNGRTPADRAQSKGHTNITSYLSSIEKTVSSEYVLTPSVYTRYMHSENYSIWFV
jgi:hypothetical protein